MAPGGWPGSEGAAPARALSVEDRGLFGDLGRREAEMPIRARSGAATARRAGEKPLLHEEGLVHLFERPGVLSYRGRDGREPYRAAIELLDDGLQDPPIHVVEAELVHVEPLQRLDGHRRGDLA